MQHWKTNQWNIFPAVFKIKDRIAKQGPAHQPSPCSLWVFVGQAKLGMAGSKSTSKWGTDGCPTLTPQVSETFNSSFVQGTFGSPVPCYCCQTFPEAGKNVGTMWHKYRRWWRHLLICQGNQPIRQRLAPHSWGDRCVGCAGVKGWQWKAVHRGGDNDEDGLMSFRVGGGKNDSQIPTECNRASRRARYNICPEPVSYWFHVKTSAQRGVWVLRHHQAPSASMLIGTRNISRALFHVTLMGWLRAGMGQELSRLCLAWSATTFADRTFCELCSWRSLAS